MERGPPLPIRWVGVGERAATDMRRGGEVQRSRYRQHAIAVIPVSARPRVGKLTERWSVASISRSGHNGPRVSRGLYIRDSHAGATSPSPRCPLNNGISVTTGDWRHETFELRYAGSAVLCPLGRRVVASDRRPWCPRLRRESRSVSSQIQNPCKTSQKLSAITTRKAQA